MQDRPNLKELLEAVADFLREDVLSDLEGRTRFHLLVALNLLAVAGREIELAPGMLASEEAGLAELLEDFPESEGGIETNIETNIETGIEALRRTHESLAAAIQEGRFDDPPARKRLLAHLKKVTADKLRIANPGFLERETERG